MLATVPTRTALGTYRRQTRQQPWTPYATALTGASSYSRLPPVLSEDERVAHDYNLRLVRQFLEWGRQNSTQELFVQEFYPYPPNIPRVVLRAQRLTGPEGEEQGWTASRNPSHDPLVLSISEPTEFVSSNDMEARVVHATERPGFYRVVLTQDDATSSWTALEWSDTYVPVEAARIVREIETLPPLFNVNLLGGYCVRLHQRTIPFLLAQLRARNSLVDWPFARTLVTQLEAADAELVRRCTEASSEFARVRTLAPVSYASTSL